MTVDVLASQPIFLHHGTASHFGIERLTDLVEKMHATGSKQAVQIFGDLCNVQKNSKTYRSCQDQCGHLEAHVVLLELAQHNSDTDVRCAAWEALAMMAFNHDENRRLIVADRHPSWFAELGTKIASSHDVLEPFSILMMLISLAPGTDVQHTFLPLLRPLAHVAATHHLLAVRTMVVELLVNLSYNESLRPKVAAAFLSDQLKQLLASVRAAEHDNSGYKFAMSLLLANLGSHPTSDGRGCLGSALDWVPFQDLSLFQDLAAATLAALEQRDWPAGSNAFHSPQRLTSLAAALARSMPWARKDMQVLVRPLMTVTMAAEAEKAVTDAAEQALLSLVEWPENFAVVDHHEEFQEVLREHAERDYDDDSAPSSSSLLWHYLASYRNKVVIKGGGILWLPAELLARAEQAYDVEWCHSMKPLLEVDRSHVLQQVPELAEDVEMSATSCTTLLGLLSQVQAHVVHTAMALWTDARFRDVEDAEVRLSTVVRYCESEFISRSTTASKLRVVAQHLPLLSAEGQVSLLVLLAAHGGVCDVQKEVGVDLAYAQITQSHAKLAQRMSFRTHVLRLLQEKRDMIVEQLFMEFNSYVNTHSLVSFRNSLANEVGIRHIPDKYAYPMQVDECQFRFWQLYSSDSIISLLDTALNEHPRRIPYDSFVSWLKDQATDTDPYSYLYAAFDVDGRVRRSCIESALCVLGVVRRPTIHSEGPRVEDFVVKVGGSEWTGLDAFMELAQRWGVAVDPARCKRMLDELLPAILNFKALDGRERLSLLLAEAEKLRMPLSKPSAEEWILAGVLRQLSVPESWVPEKLGAVEFEHEFPRLSALLKAAQ
eukprot:gnl/TRDRNA2_/TRDRNA2_106833_c0_seq1.p1 gnl/TRDRNA2_/TRDRNA2_106833_c0~~gnl/TRDRNA2_/TRDRNA2_106833_c0_seq1.p1  ORF type:complete len:828 (+),score=144.07 gnl/TRDRNA2_/TRDRNA2_106833_c0_seq1:38-2521(+)